MHGLKEDLHRAHREEFSIICCMCDMYHIFDKGDVHKDYGGKWVSWKHKL